MTLYAGDPHSRTVCSMQNRACSMIEVDRFYPSRKACSLMGCGRVLEQLRVAVRQWTGLNCYTIHDCDIDAAGKRIESPRCGSALAWLPKA